MTSKEIGRTLGISAGTVDAHMAHAMRKLDARSRREAVRWLEEAGVDNGKPLKDDNEDWGSDPIRGAEGTRQDYRQNQSRASAQTPRRKARRRGQKGGRRWLPQSGMGAVLVRSLLDVLYGTAFFAALSFGAFVANLIIVQCEAANVDHVVVQILKVTHYLLVGLDGFGIICATGSITFRFILATIAAIRNDE